IFPSWLAYDGVNVWVTNSGSNTLTQIRASDGVVLGNFATGSMPAGVVFDGANVWVANSGSNTVSEYLIRSVPSGLLSERDKRLMGRQGGQHRWPALSLAAPTRRLQNSCVYRGRASPTKCARSIGGECLGGSHQLLSASSPQPKKILRECRS